MSLKDNMPSGFNRQARIETQEAAKFNFHKRLREQDEKRELRQAVQSRIEEESKASKTGASQKKGK